MTTLSLLDVNPQKLEQQWHRDRVAKEKAQFAGDNQTLTPEQSKALAAENIRRCKAYAALPPELKYGWKPEATEPPPVKRAHQSPARRAKQAARAQAFFAAKDAQSPVGFSRVA